MDLPLYTMYSAANCLTRALSVRRKYSKLSCLKQYVCNLNKVLVYICHEICFLRGIQNSETSARIGTYFVTYVFVPT